MADELKITTVVDNSQLDQNIKRTEEAFTNLYTQLKNLNLDEEFSKQMANAARSAETGEDAFKGLFEAIRTQGRDATALLEEMKKGMEEYIKSCEELGNSDAAADYRETLSALEALTEELGGNREAVDDAIEGYDELADSQGGVKEVSDDMVSAMKGAYDLILGKTQNLEGTIKKIYTAYSGFQKLMQNQGVDIAEATKKMGLLNKASLALGKALVRAGMSADVARLALSKLSAIPVVAAISVIIIAIRKLIKHHQEAKAAAEEAARVQEEFFSEVSKGAAPNIAKFQELSNTWKNLSTDMAKTEFLKNSKQAFDELGISVNSLQEAQNILVDNAEPYIQAQMKMAQADALRARVRTQTEELLDLQQKLETTPEGKKKRTTVKEAVYNEDTGKTEYIEVKRKLDERERIQRQIEEKTKEITDSQKRVNELVQEGNILLDHNGEFGVWLDPNKENKTPRGGASSPDYVAQLEKAEKDIEKFKEKLQEWNRKAQDEANVLSIEGMNDGFEKEMAELDHEHDERLEAIEEQFQERIAKIEELQREVYKAQHEGSEIGFVFNVDDSLVGDAIIAKNQEVLNEEKRDLQERSKIYQKTIDEYKDYVDEWEELTEKFNDDRLRLALSGEIIDNPKILNELTEKEREAFEKLAASWATSGRDSGFQKWFEELGQQSLADLEIMLSDLENDMELFGDNLPEDEVKRLKAQILLLNKAIRDGNYADETEPLDENAQKATTSWADLNKVLTDTAALFQQAGDAIGGSFGESLKMVGKFTTAIAQIGNAVEAFKEAKDIIGQVTSSITIAGAAVSIAAEVAGRIKEARERTKEVNEATKAYYRTLKSIQDSQVLESFSNAFGTDSFGQFSQYMSIAKKAGESITSISKTISNESVTIKNWGKVLLESAISPLGTLFGIGSAAKRGKTVAADFVSDMRTGWQKFWGSEKNIMTASMSDFFDENGNLLGEKLQEWYKTYGEGLSEANKAVVEDMLAEFNRLEDSKKEINSFLGSLFGDVAADIASDMVDSFIETGDAIQDMSKYMNDFGKSVAKSIVQGKLMAKVFSEEDQEAIADLLAAGKTSDAIAAFNNVMDKAKSMAPEIQEFLTEIGAGGWKDTEQSRTATSRSALGASQDSIDESNGRLTAIQSQVYLINQTITGFQANYERLIANTAAMIEHTQGIHVDTTELKGMVSEMRELSRSVNRNVSQMVEKGVVMR